MSNSLTDGQKAVLKAFHEFNRPMDDQALTVYVHHIADTPMSSSGIRSRRAELTRTTPLPLVKVTGIKTLASGRKAAVHGLTTAGKAKAKALFDPKPTTKKKVAVNAP
jgi:hypothetical protein